MLDVTALGEILIDFTPCGDCDGIPIFAQNPGGAPLNVLAQNALLGGKTAFIGKVGADVFGDDLRRMMANNDINTQGLVISKDVHTTLAFVQLDSKGERSFCFYRNPGADILLRKEEVAADLIRNSHIFHFGSLSTTSEPSRSATYEALRTAKEAGCIISYDPNYRAPLWESEEVAIKAMLDLMPYADILKVSDDEMKLLTGTDDFDEGSRKLADYGITFVCVSCGSEGAYYRRGNEFGKVPAFEVCAVDTNGAGDAFLGAIHYQIRKKSLADLKQMPRNELEAIIRFANAAGALAVLKKGAIPAMANMEMICSFLEQKDRWAANQVRSIRSAKTNHQHINGIVPLI
ncbi:MAG: carbohydrate kinase family protein [Oscillospiraceae bacterium]